jgi:hypothetical protein
MNRLVLVILVLLSIAALVGSVFISVVLFNFAGFSVDCKHNSKRCFPLANTTDGCQVMIDDEFGSKCHIARACPETTETTCYTYFGSETAVSCDWSFNCRQNWAFFVVMLLFGIFFLVSLPCITMIFWSMLCIVYSRYK